MIVRTVRVGQLGTNCYIVGCEDERKAVVIDPGAEPERIIQALRADGFTCGVVVNTHGHADHIAANGAVKAATGAAIAVHMLDAEALADPSVNLSAFAMPPGLRVEGPRADRLLAEGEEVVAGSVRLRVVHTPGHTPGSISLVGDGVVFCGDTLFAGGGVGRTDFPGGSYDLLVMSITEKIFSLPDDTVVYPGHGPSTTVGTERW
ncbi:MAG: MBL fold metallo-hydrolase [Firmicutes bacterium]|nr:MBL fold metallo-hydrolase [Bacillota bacterium]MDH7495584.1 MBL fold metallo-hydrolase [Bacillota bacterium]